MSLDTHTSEMLSNIARAAEERDAERRALHFNLPYIPLDSVPIEIEALSHIAEESARLGNLAPIKAKGKELLIVVYNPEESETIKAIDSLKKSGFSLKIAVVSKSGLNHAWELYKFIKSKQAEITGRVIITKSDKNILNSETLLENIGGELLKKINNNDTEEKIIDFIFKIALELSVSDIHFEPSKNKTEVRFRIDGILHEVGEVTTIIYERLLARIKLLGEMKLNIHDTPQDGRFTLVLEEREIEVRVSILPSEYGETIVMRVLDPSKLKIDLTEIGLRSDNLALLDIYLKRPNGLILVTGPTGSGKTTFLYGCVAKIKSPEVKIITIEDPIEYHLLGIEQTQVNEEKGYTFLNGLRSIVRQDPDIILIGEIRDKETAEIGMQASLTGHLVFSTLHTNDSFGAVARLIELGVKPSIVSEAINIIIAERLIRRLCKSCKLKVELAPEFKTAVQDFLAKLPENINKNEYINFTIYKAVGCNDCGGIGYKGRLGIFEFLEITKITEKTK